MTLPPDARLARVVLDGEALTRLSPILEADRAQAVADLAADSRFAPVAVKARRLRFHRGEPAVGGKVRHRLRAVGLQDRREAGECRAVQHDAGEPGVRRLAHRGPAALSSSPSRPARPARRP